MEKFGIVLIMGHLPRLLVLQKGSKRVHKIPLEVDQQVSPPAWYDGIPRRAKTAIPDKIQLKDSNHYSSFWQYPVRQEAKEGLQPLIKKVLKHGLLKLCQSPCNTPILPVVKQTGEYRMV
jgi:hypothetical protein